MLTTVSSPIPSWKFIESLQLQTIKKIIQCFITKVIEKESDVTMKQAIDI